MPRYDRMEATGKAAEAAREREPVAIAPEPEAASVAPAAPAQPASVRVRHHYAYYDDDGALRAWHEGQVVSDPDEIADLVLRSAPCDEV